MTKKITKTNGYLPSVLKEKLTLLVLAAAFVTGGVQAQVVTTITTPGAGTFTVPANVATMTVECWGGGGAGGSAENTAFTDAASAVRAGGGAGGSYSKITITNPEAGNYDYAVGAGGIAPASGFSDGHVSNGGNTIFDHSTVNIARALGGPGAVSKSFSSTLNWTGTGAIAPTTGNIEGANITNFYGGNGGNALGIGTAGTGGGGGSAGYSSNGNAGTTLTGGAAVTGGASGGDGTNIATGATGSAGGSPGAGGAGSLIRKTSAITDLRYRAGGSGGNGQIKITYTLVAASSTVAMTAPTNKTVVAIGGSVELSATIALKDGNTFTSIVFKDGSTTIPGTITNSGNVYSITYANVPAGRRVITAELTDNQETVTSATHIIYGGPVAVPGNKYAQSAITWNIGPWFDDPTDGQVVTAPAAGDNVYTQGYAVTISDDATCDNLTFTDAVGQIGIAADKTLTVRGKVDCAVASTADAFSTSNATSILKLTGAALTTTPYFIITDKAIPGIRVKNIVIQAADSKTYQFGESTSANYFHGTGSFTIKNGTTITLQPTMIMGQGGSNHFVVEDNAFVTANGAIKGISANASRTTQITINGSITCSGFLSATTLILGNSAIVKTAKADGGSYQTFDGWWGYPGIIVDGTSYGTPGSIAMGTNTTIEFNKGGNQNINGFVPANGTPMVGYAIPYVNLNLLGSGIKTVRSNLTVSKSLEIALGVTMVVPSGVTLTIAAGAKVTNNGTITNEGTINFLSDASNGTATIIGDGVINGLGITKVNQYLTTGRNWYIANPMSTAVSPTVASGTITLNKYDEAIVTDAAGATGWAVTTDALAVGKGYVATVSVDGNVSFTGALNNGDINIALTSRAGTTNKAGFNLIGNPYQSYLDWSLVMANTANAALLRTNTLWYRTKKLNQASEMVYQFQTVNGDGVSVPNDGNAVIPPMQSLWVRAVAGVSSPIVVTNAMRAHAPGSDKLLKAPAINNRTLVRLQVSNGVNTDETVIYQSQNANNDLDTYDAPKISNGNANIPEIYTTLGSEKIVINSMNSIPTDSPIGVGFVAGNSSSFTLRANEITNIPEGVKVMLRDNVTLAETDLTDGTASYGFTPQTSSGDRFSLIFRTAGATTGIENTNNLSAKVYVNTNSQLVIAASKESNYAIYNALGQQIENGILKTELQTIDCKLQTGIYVVKVNNQSTRVIIK